MNGKPRLRALDGPDDGREWPLDRDRITLGRRDDQTIPVLWHGGVSRWHAEIVRNQGLFWLCDVKSTGGTCLALQGEESWELDAGEPVLLVRGMVVSLGHCAHFLVLDVEADAGPVVRRALSLVEQLCLGLACLPEAEREKQLAELVEFERRLSAVKSEQELAQCVGEGLSTLGDQPDDQRPGPEPVPPEKPAEAPLFPDPCDPNRMPSLRDHHARGRLRRSKGDPDE
jgi:hypothetical protein